MIRILSFIVLVLHLFSFDLRAQIYSEDFNTGTALNAWTLVDGDGRVPANAVSQYTSAWILALDSSAADSCASSTSWYQPLGQADDWMISPAINLTSANILSWDAFAQDNRFPDGYEVRISTTNTDTASFLSNPPLFSIAAENPFWTRRTLNLDAAGYFNRTVYLAWRNNSNDQYILNIDNIRIDAINGNDAKLLTALNIVDELWQIPIDFMGPINFLSAIENVGADTLFNLRSICEVYRNGSVVYVDSSQTLSALPPTDSALMNFNNTYTPIQAGDYYVKYSARFNGSDIDSTNDFYFTDTLSITDSTFARDDDLQNSSIGIGAGTPGEIGHTYTITAVDTLTSVSVYILNPNGQMNGQPISLNVRNFTSSPSTIIASSDTLIYSNPGASWVDLSFTAAGGYVPLPAGRFFLGMVEGDSNLTIGTTLRSYTPLVNYIRFPGGLTNGWNPLDAYNIQTTLMIRPNFGPTRGVLVGTKEILARQSKPIVFPNPSVDGSIQIRWTNEQRTNKVVRVLNTNGSVVYIQGFNEESISALELSTLGSGLYFLEIRVGDEIFLEKLLIDR